MDEKETKSVDSGQCDVLVYATGITPRLKYICKLLLGEILGLKFRITADTEEYINAACAKICYNTRSISVKECLIVPAGLINERGINNHQVNVIEYNETKALFPVYTRETCLPFDIFSAAFYMVSRYEEYLPFIRDEHGRFSASSSLAKQKGFIQLPVVNIWVKELGRQLVRLFPWLTLKEHIFRFVPTIDIDAAWAFRHKGFYRSLGGFLKDLRQMDADGFRRRYRSLMRLEQDPFDSFELMHSMHKKYGLRPLFFILFAGYGEYDKNTPVNNTYFRELIKSLGDEGEVGIHPSYASYRNDQILHNEIAGLSEVLHREVTCSRQHFLKLHMPDTYRSLISHDITDDFTMGFASEPGFRAGICMPFKWYDLEMERSTNLTIHPFMIMDGTLRDYMKVEAEGAMQVIRPLIDSVKFYGGTFISLFHNESLAEWRRWKGWTAVYEEMLRYGSSVAEKVNK
ncbi:MAG TPA: polysaccharide deacetylase family protein [Bacteroidales bacterium]|nr:polysaccharide deacetylase family protein [Bacteroidales bacterium]